MAGELILIVEDNEKNRKLARDVLQVKGYRTIETETAEEGLKFAVEKRPALILMDIQLPCIGDPVFYAFDIIWLKGRDLRELSLLERKKILRSVIPRKSSWIGCVSYVDRG